MSIPVLIITGFLGAGKTSFLRQLLPLCGEAGVRPALIINEVGTVDVDGELLADLHAEQARLVGGCVCCTLQAQLSQTVEDLLDRQAGDIIIIECSGMSNPLDVVSALSTPAFVSRVAVSHILCLLDASRVAKTLQHVELARTQAAMANVLVLNKADNLEAGQQETVAALAHNVNPHAKKYWTAYGDMGRAALLDILQHTPATRQHCACGHTHDDHTPHAHHAHVLPASFCTVALPLPYPIAREALETLLHALPDNVIRAKGFAVVADEGWHVLHKVYDSVDTYPHAGPPPNAGSVLICIGQHLQPALLQSLVPA
ncbi:MAG TPA: GTP-binding protein [Armatimonadota bacterium]